MILDSNKVYRVSPDSQTFADASLAAGMGGRGGRGAVGGGGAGGDRGAAVADVPVAVRQAAIRAEAGAAVAVMNPMTVLQDAVITGMQARTIEELGAGESIETRPTKKYRITVDYDFKLYGQPRQAKTTLGHLGGRLPSADRRPVRGHDAEGRFDVTSAGIQLRASWRRRRRSRACT